MLLIHCLINKTSLHNPVRIYPAILHNSTLKKNFLFPSRRADKHDSKPTQTNLRPLYIHPEHCIGYHPSRPPLLLKFRLADRPPMNGHRAYRPYHRSINWIRQSYALQHRTNIVRLRRYYSTYNRLGNEILLQWTRCIPNNSRVARLRKLGFH